MSTTPTSTTQMSTTRMSAAHDTTAARLVPRTGDGPLRTLVAGPGEEHRARTELLADAGIPSSADPRRLAGLIHITDFQIADLASPSRVEFLQQRTEREWARMLPACRPQEFLLAHAMEAMARTIRGLVAADPNAWDLAVSTGDNTDSAQSNELSAYLTMLDGGTVDPAFSTRAFADAPVLSGDPAYYNPEPGTEDRWKREQGLPDHPGAVAAAAQPFSTAGLPLPWITAFGNHDCLVQGRAPEPAGFEELLQGSAKPVGLCPDVPAGDKLDAYVADPLWAATGPSRTIAADRERRMVERREYMQRHLEAPGTPRGHGFTPAGVAADTAYAVHDEIPGVRIIVLDTTNRAGHVDGRLDAAQFAWLTERLIEVHSRYRDADGAEHTHEADDRLVVLASHHGLSTLTNDAGTEPVHLADDVEALLHRFDQVVLWLSGHTHVHRITPRPGAGGGFWEVCTGSIAEWPVQLRTLDLELLDQAVRIRTTVHDVDAAAMPGPGTTPEDLAALHRLVAANDAGSVGGLHAEGTPDDRNTDLFVPLDPRAALRLRDRLR